MTPAGSTAGPIAWPPDPVERAAAAAAGGLRRPLPAGMAAALAGLVSGDPEPRVRTAALGALARLPDPPREAWGQAAGDPDPSVRRRAAELAPAYAGAPGRGATRGTDDEGWVAGGDRRSGTGNGDRAGVAGGLLTLLADKESSVAEAAAWALGELGPESEVAGAVGPLAEAAATHGDPLVREAAVAALGALGDPEGLEAVLAACRDRPAVRRRAVLALAPFEGPEVDAALRAALDDKDWQTRQAAEDLLR